MISTKNELQAIHIAKELSVPCRDKKGKFVDETRLTKIEELLSDSAYHCVKRSPLARIYAKKPLKKMGSHILVFSSHVDCLQKKAVFEENESCIHGIWDNAITNAALVTCMLEDAFPEDVAIAFTGNEEHGMKGADQIAELLGKKFADIVVLDVTDEGWEDEAAFTIENAFFHKGSDEWWAEHVIDLAINSGSRWRYVSGLPENEENAKEYIPEERLLAKMPGDVPVYEMNGELREAGMDEACEYDEYGYGCFSLCIPIYEVDGEMHRQEGIDARKKSYFAYIQMLKDVASLEKVKARYLIQES